MTEWPASPGCDRCETRRFVATTILSKGLAETFDDPCGRVVIAMLTVSRGRGILYSTTLCSDETR